MFFSRRLILLERFDAAELDWQRGLISDAQLMAADLLRKNGGVE